MWWAHSGNHPPTPFASTHPHAPIKASCDRIPARTFSNIFDFRSLFLLLGRAARISPPSGLLLLLLYSLFYLWMLRSDFPSIFLFFFFVVAAFCWICMKLFKSKARSREVLWFPCAGQPNTGAYLGAHGSEEADPWWIFAASSSKPADLSVVWSDLWRILWGKIKKLSSERFFLLVGFGFAA